MDDPWDVKSVRKSGHYTSCMKINGVPLLPPVLSKECRIEMQYYKLLAKEVEKRISILQPYIDTDTDSSDDRTDAPEIPECEIDYELAKVSKEQLQTELYSVTEKITVDIKEKCLDGTFASTLLDTDFHDPKLKDKTASENYGNGSNATSPPFLHFSLNTYETERDANKSSKSPSPPPVEIPERDYNCVKTIALLTNEPKEDSKQKDKIDDEIIKFVDLFGENLNLDGPPSLSCKSFTGSLDNLHLDMGRNAQKLVRQRSYTILNPSPQLLAHLEVQSVNLGVDVSCISMSESRSNLSTPGKKRRNWDLESAKVKWSNMALEMKQKNLGNRPNYSQNKTQPKTTPSPPTERLVPSDKVRRSSVPSKVTPKSEPIQRNTRTSPTRGIPSNGTIILEEPMTFRTGKPKNKLKEPTSPKILGHKKLSHEPVSPKAVKETPKSASHKKETNSLKSTTPKPLISESNDPATKVKELYEKIQKQQLAQMASLVEKQKREQMLLQQVFEEQNNLLFKQLKTICPKSPTEVKEAWGDKQEGDRGPVSLSQLINTKSPETFRSPVTSTLTDSNKYINHCDNVLKKSRDLSTSINKRSQNGNKAESPKFGGSRTRTHSPSNKITTSRRLNYDTSGSSERDYEPILTDRTNDTMADLNVTFPSDSDDGQQFSHISGAHQATVIHKTPGNSARSTDSAIKSMEQTIQDSINNSRTRRYKAGVNYHPTANELSAACTIVAYARGFLVRRLMRTARVQTTVQTIKDALLCALQLHQDREGIRGADVDLHRRLIQQITAACYCLHDTFIASTPAERCALIAADRGRRASLARRAASPARLRPADIMSQSHSGVFPARPKRFAGASAALMTQSSYETYSSEAARRARYMPSPRRRPWR